MADDDAPKSAVELAMARLRAKDREAGVTEKPLTDAQREAIAEARRVAEARLAEREILYQSRRRGVVEPEALATLEEEYRRDRDRVLYDRDRKIESIREQGPSS
jgi:hypothetical protein